MHYKLSPVAGLGWKNLWRPCSTVDEQDFEIFLGSVGVKITQRFSREYSIGEFEEAIVGNES